MPSSQRKEANVTGCEQLGHHRSIRTTNTIHVISGYVTKRLRLIGYIILIKVVCTNLIEDLEHIVHTIYIYIYIYIYRNIYIYIAETDDSGQWQWAETSGCHVAAAATHADATREKL